MPPPAITWGITLRCGRDDQGLNEALPWLEKAVILAPDNASYIGDYALSASFPLRRQVQRKAGRRAGPIFFDTTS